MIEKYGWMMYMYQHMQEISLLPDYSENSVFLPLFKSLESKPNSFLMKNMTQEGCLELCIYIAVFGSAKFIEVSKNAPALAMKRVYHKELNSLFPNMFDDVLSDRILAYFDLVGQGKTGAGRLTRYFVQAKANQLNISGHDFILQECNWFLLEPAPNTSECFELRKRIENFIDPIAVEIATIVLAQISNCTDRAFKKLQGVSKGARIRLKYAVWLILILVLIIVYFYN